LPIGGGWRIFGWEGEFEIFDENVFRKGRTYRGRATSMFEKLS
jgi:hypothetical protein